MLRDDDGSKGKGTWRLRRAVSLSTALLLPIPPSLFFPAPHHAYYTGWLCDVLLMAVPLPYLICHPVAGHATLLAAAGDLLISAPRVGSSHDRYFHMTPCPAYAGMVCLLGGQHTAFWVHEILDTFLQLLVTLFFLSPPTLLQRSMTISGIPIGLFFLHTTCSCT